MVCDKVVCVCDKDVCVCDVCDKDVCVCVCDKVACANKRKACHPKRRWMSPSAMLATQNQGQCRQVPRLPGETKVDVAVPHLPRETKVDVTKCHACHVKRRQMSPRATPATQKCRSLTAPKRATSPISTTPATQNEGRCHLPRKRRRRPRRQTGTKRVTRASPVP